MSIDGNSFINPLTMCEVTVELTNAEHETITQVVKLGYYRVKINSALQKTLDAFMDLAQKNSNDLDAVKALLYPAFLNLVGWWNVTRGGQMWPLVKEEIWPMDPYYIGVLIFGIIGHHNQGLNLGEATRGPSESAPLSNTTAPEAPDATTASPTTISKSSAISRFPSTSRRSGPGTGKPHRSTTTQQPRSGLKRKSS